MQHFKRTITWVLLIFVVAAAAMILRPQETVVVPDGFSILFWHAKKRCTPCLKMEALLRQTLQEYQDVHLIELEYDVFANQSLAQQFNVGRTTIILVERKDQQNVRVRDLATEVWKTIHDEAAFTAMLQEELTMFYE
jgi:thiol-disulfide isomerase/thioredoxin